MLSFVYYHSATAMTKYDSPVAMPTVHVTRQASSYEEGYIAGYYSGAHPNDNPYVPSEGMYDFIRWEQGRWDGRLNWRMGDLPAYQQEEK
jgi:hypothetical protein